MNGNGKFKVGEDIVCVDPGPYNAILTKGKVYKVKESGENVVRVLGDAGRVEGFFPYRFERVEDTMNEYVTLNGVAYRVENIPGKGECLVPVKRKPKAGEVWMGPMGGVYVVTASDETQGFEFRSNVVYPIPRSAAFVSKTLNDWFNNGGNV